jgi:hypothetical protein
LGGVAIGRDFTVVIAIGAITDFLTASVMNCQKAAGKI